MLVRGRLCKPRAEGIYLIYYIHSAEVPPTEAANRSPRCNPRQVKLRSRGVIMLSKVLGDRTVVNELRWDAPTYSVRSEDRTGGARERKCAYRYRHKKIGCSIEQPIFSKQPMWITCSSYRSALRNGS